jgi:hypothetical protein
LQTKNTVRARGPRVGSGCRRPPWPPPLLHQAAPPPAEARELPDRTIPDRKMGSGGPSIITSHAPKMLDRFVMKNPRAAASYGHSPGGLYCSLSAVLNSCPVAFNPAAICKNQAICVSLHQSSTFT